MTVVMTDANANHCDVIVTPEASEQSVQERAAARLKYLNHEGRSVAGVSPLHSPKSVPVWFDPIAFRHAQRLHRTYAVIINISEFYGLMLVLNIYEGLAPLLVTGNSATVGALFDRYLSTMVHVRNWFQYDPFDPRSKAYRSLKTVRGLHRQASTRMNQLDGRKEGLQNQELWMSQWAMFGAQFTFVGFMTVFPKQLGFHTFTPYDFHCMFHFWRVIGHCLGIEDRFNLCAGSDEDTAELCRQMYHTQWRPKIVAAGEPTGVAMGRGIAAAMSRLTPAIHYNAWLHYGAPFLGLDQSQYPLRGWWERLLCGSIRLLCVRLARWPSVLWCISRATAVRLWLTITMRRYHRRTLDRRYADERFEADHRCPMQVQLNYRSALDSKLY